MLRIQYCVSQLFDACLTEHVFREEMCVSIGDVCICRGVTSDIETRFDNCSASLSSTTVADTVRSGGPTLIRQHGGITGQDAT